MDIDNEENESDNFQRQALEIVEPGNDFDPTIPPQNGEEYLMHMIYERKRCPAVVVVKCPRNFAGTEKNEAKIEKEEQENELQNFPASLLPTTEWKATQTEDFLATRDKIVNMRQVLNAHSYDNELEPPLTKDAAEWLHFCQQQQPLLQIVLRINQRNLEQLLEMLCDWLRVGADTPPGEQHQLFCASSSSSTAASCNGGPIDLSNSEQWLGTWLYSTLVCLQLPLEPEVHSTLRDIARTCTRLRGRLQPEELEKAVPYNLFIHLISNVFDQLDLAEFV